VQGTLEGAIAAVTGETVKIVGSGRTDAGAHALRQVIAFSTHSPLPAAVLCRAVNAHLPDDIAVTSVCDVDPSFHPRYDASSRVYRYLVWNRSVRSPFWTGRAAHVPYRLDEGVMGQAAASLVGARDLAAFVPAAIRRDTRREIYRAACWREGDLLLIELEANGFMRQMVRAIVGTLLEVGLGKMAPSDFERILLSGDRRRAGRTVPAAGLYLMNVRYPPNIQAALRLGPGAGPAG